MKKIILPAIFILQLIVLVICSSYKIGPAASKGLNLTGADANNALGCGNGSCHGATATPGITIAIELDSAGRKIDHYVPGGTYALKFVATNTTTSLLPYFGFQLCVIKDSVSSSSPQDVGTWGTLTTNIHLTKAGTNGLAASVVEHGNLLYTSPGPGGKGTTYTESIPWKAPVAGTGKVSFWAVVNCVVGKSASANDKWNTASLIVDESLNGFSGIAPIDGSFQGIVAYPNPFKDNLNISSTAGQSALGHSVAYDVFDGAGKHVLAGEMANDHTTINTNNWAKGNYTLLLRNNTHQKQVLRLLKN